MAEQAQGATECTPDPVSGEHKIIIRPRVGQKCAMRLFHLSTTEEMCGFLFRKDI